MVAVEQAANIGIQFQGKRPSGPAFVIWSIPTKRTLADAEGKAGDADGGKARQHVEKLGGHRAAIVRVAVSARTKHSKSVE